MNFLHFIKQEELKASLWAKRHIVAALTLCFGVGLFTAGLWGIFENYQLRKVLQQLEISNTQHKHLLSKHAEAILTAERLRATNYALTETIREQSTVNRELERGIDFYRKLLDPSKAQEGLVLQNVSVSQLSLHPSNNVNMFKVRFTFVQYALRHKLMRADILFTLNGEKNGKLTSIAFKDLMQSSNSETQSKLQNKLRFKFFQDIEQIITIPDGFSPMSFTIKATLKNTKKRHWEKETPWPYANTAPDEIHAIPKN
ncbi:MAG: hypothetical protein KAG18_07465 [Sinobacterium sp.]|nr:hypothetical protein [Sinobacterium sp.]